MVEVSNIRTNKKFCLLNVKHPTYFDKKRNSFQWYKYKDGWICKRCHNRLITNPKFHPIYNPIFHSRYLLFKDKHFLLKENPRTGYCSWCPNNTHDGSCKRTHLHHVEYNDKNILENTIEICAACHAKETLRLKMIKKRKKDLCLDSYGDMPVNL
jgi:hypothetical protein